MTTAQEMVTEGLKAAPPVTVTGLALGGIQLSDIVLLLTALYTVLQIFFLIRDKWWRRRDRKAK
jgi:hypothetical protein